MKNPIPMWCIGIGVVIGVFCGLIISNYLFTQKKENVTTRPTKQIVEYVSVLEEKKRCYEWNGELRSDLSLFNKPEKRDGVLYLLDGQPINLYCTKTYEQGTVENMKTITERLFYYQL